MKHNKLVSVIMSTYNEKDLYLKESIESILSQSYTNIEFIIVIDNPENIELIKVVDSYKRCDKRIKVIKNDFNIGLVSSLNKALEIAKGDYIARMDADDIAMENRLELQVKYLEQNTQIHLVGSDMIFIDENSKEINRNKVLVKNHNLIKLYLKYGNCMNHPTWMIKSELFKKNKLRYRDIPYAEDYDFICRVITNNYKVHNLEDKLIKYRIRQESITRSNVDRQLRSARYISKIYNHQLKFNKDIYNRIELEKILNNENKIKNYVTKLTWKIKGVNRKIIEILDS